MLEYWGCYSFFHLTKYIMVCIADYDTRCDCHFLSDVMESDFWVFQWVTETSSNAKDPITVNHRRWEKMKGKIRPSVLCSGGPGICKLIQLCYLLNIQNFLKVSNVRHWISETFRKFRKWACFPFFILHF